MADKIVRSYGLDYEQALIAIGHVAMNFRKCLLRDWVARNGWRVQVGPFSSMTLSSEASWGDGDILSKLIGTYESELHSVILGLSAGKSYSSIINIGCGEGFYAVGMARLHPSARVIAVDIDENALRICNETARLNGVHERIQTIKSYSACELSAFLLRSERSLLIVDCEGEEVAILDPEKVPELKNADLIVECHDFVHPSTTALLTERFMNTHKIIRIPEQNCCLDLYPGLWTMSSIDRAIATCEFRPVRMNWLYCCTES